MRSSSVVIAAVASIAVLMPFGPTGCHMAAYTNSICRPTQAYRAGEAQAQRGQAIDYSIGHACTGETQETFATNFEAGYRAGRQSYCDPSRVWSAGMEDGKAGAPAGFQPQHYAICEDVPALQAAYGQGHAAGIEQRCQPAHGEQAGSADGASGQPARFDAAPYAMCGADRVQAIGDAYQRGYQGGLAGFCAPERWERWGLEVGNQGHPPADVRGSLAACPAEQRELVVSHYQRGYEQGLAGFCAPERWEPWARDLGAQGHAAPNVSGSTLACSPPEREDILFYVQRGYREGLRTYCSNSAIASAGREAARNGTGPTLPAAYAVCLDAFPRTQTIFASAYQAELAWMQQQWGSTPPMTPVQFQTLLQHVQSQSFASDRLAQMKDAARHSHFTSEQVVALMNLLSFDSDKIEAAVALYPVVVDRANWFQVYAALTYSSSRDELAQRISTIP